MARYIDADALIEKIKAKATEMFTVNSVYEYYIDALIDVEDIIKAEPTADVVERNKGEWKHDKDDNLVSGYCSCCGWTAMIMETDVADMPFCPNCGADLRKRMDCFCCDGKNTMVYVQSRFNGHKRGFCTKCGSSFIE